MCLLPGAVGRTVVHQITVLGTGLPPSSPERRAMRLSRVSINGRRDMIVQRASGRGCGSQVWSLQSPGLVTFTSQHCPRALPAWMARRVGEESNLMSIKRPDFSFHLTTRRVWRLTHLDLQTV